MKHQGIKVVREGKRQLYIPADRVMLEQALLNLIVNALDAMPTGGTLAVKIRWMKDKAMVSVSDSGKGIAQEVQESIFSPFFTTKEDGTGLGLSIVDHIVRLHKGKISFTTGETGSTFTISLKSR